MNSVLLTGSNCRHAFYANQINKVFNLCGIVVEKKRDQVSSTNKTHFTIEHQNNREAYEKKYFGDFSFDSLKVDKMKIKSGNINSLNVFDWICSKSPNIIFVYGTSIIKDPLLNLYKNRIINLHLGLSPYYKGSATNIWPIVNKQPECIGATFHIINEKVDAGPIIHQYRPILKKTDTIHDIGNKTIRDSEKEIMKLYHFIKNEQAAHPQDNNIKSYVYKKNDFNEKSLKTAYKNLRNNLLFQYISNKKERDNKYKIVQLKNDSHS